MIKLKDIQIGMKVFVVNCDRKEVTATTVTGLDIHPERLSRRFVKVKSGIKTFFCINDLLRLLNTDSSQDTSCYGILLTTISNGFTKHRFFISLTEKDAYRHLAENVHGYNLLETELKAEEAHKQYMDMVEQVGHIEKAREEIRKKYSEL